MFRYFLVPDAQMPTPEHNVGHWHAIHLHSHGSAGKGWNLIVLHDRHVPAPEGWQQMPRVVDSKTPISAKIDHRLLKDIGLTGAETTLEAADHLGSIHPAFEHP